MWLSKNLSKIGLLVSFLAALAYELTGANSLKAISIVLGIVSLSMLIPYLSQTQYISRTREMLHYLKLLK